MYPNLNSSWWHCCDFKGAGKILADIFGILKNLYKLLLAKKIKITSLVSRNSSKIEKCKEKFKMGTNAGNCDHRYIPICMELTLGT
jgi:hypothetical protein